jgi:SAM-dependent methyltransferase
MPYDEAYFQNQISKSDDKVAWQYGQLLAFSGLAGRASLMVLDAGCGAGPGLRYLTAQGHRAFGCDLFTFPLQVASQLAPAARLAQNDLNDPLPFSDSLFDLVLLSEVIEHVQNATALLKECWRVLTGGGVVVATTPNLWDARRLYYPLVRRTWAGDADPTHIELFDPPKLRRVLAAAGFADGCVVAGFKPLAWVSLRRPRLRIAIPAPPLIGNTLIARGYKEARRLQSD